MKETQIQFAQPHQESYIAQAVNLVNHYSTSGLTSKVTIDDHKALAAMKKLVVAVNAENDVVGTVAYTKAYPRDIWELGALAVKEEWQHQGIATSLVQALLQENPHGKVLAAANFNSKPLLEKMGAVEINKSNVLPIEIYDLCAGCIRKPEKGCCDSFLSLVPIILKLIGDQTEGLSGIDMPAEKW